MVMVLALAAVTHSASAHAGAQIPWSAIGSVTSLVIAVCSMVVAVWQTRIARRAARIAQDAATAAAVQASASVAQTNLLRQQVEAEQRDRVRQMEPRFSLRAAGDEEWGTLKPASHGESFTVLSPTSPPPFPEWFRRQTLELRLEDGPAEVDVTAEVIRSPQARVKPLGGTMLARGGSLKLEVITPYDMAGKKLTLEVSSRDSRSPDAELAWSTRLSVTV
jgi:hypothetical protein